MLDCGQKKWRNLGLFETLKPRFLTFLLQNPREWVLWHRESRGVRSVKDRTGECLRNWSRKVGVRTEIFFIVKKFQMTAGGNRSRELSVHSGALNPYTTTIATRPIELNFGKFREILIEDSNILAILLHISSSWDDERSSLIDQSPSSKPVPRDPGSPHCQFGPKPCAENTLKS